MKVACLRSQGKRGNKPKLELVLILMFSLTTT